MKTLTLTLSLAVLALSASSAAAVPKARHKGKYLSVNGVDYYYEQHGKKGEPLLLLHGGLGSIEMFGPVLPLLAKERRVIAVDLHGHGRTALGARAFSVEAMGNDMADLVKQLGHAQLDVMGYSLGAGVAFRMAVQRPQSVRRLVLASGAFSNDAYYPELRAQQAQVSGAMAPMMKGTPMHDTYMALAPKPDDFPKLLDALGAFMKSKLDWSADVKKLKGPVMLVYGDSDMFRPEHMIQFYQLLGGGLKDAGWNREHMSKNRLAILPDLTHYDLFTSPRLAATVLPFLNGASDAKSWASQTGALK